MGKLFLAVAIGLVGAVLVHIAVIGFIPSLAEHNAWGRFANLGPMEKIVRVVPLRSSGPETIASVPGSDRENFAFIDPAFVTASCRFSLVDGPVRMFATTLRSTFWTASIYDRNGDNLYSINDRSAVDGAFDLIVGTPDQIIDRNASLQAGSNERTIPVEVDLREGYLTIRVLVSEESQRAEVDRFVQSLRCQPQQTLATGPAPPDVAPSG